MPYKYNPFTGELDRTDGGGGGSGGIDSIDTDSGTATPVGGVVDIVGDATQGSTTSGTGDTVTITNTDASETQIGVSELATDAEAITGTDTDKVIVPAALKAKLGSQTDSGIAFGDGDTNAIEWTSALTDGQLVIGDTAGSPAAANITGGTGIDITDAANSITIDASDSTPISFPTDTGTATPASNALTISGGTGMDTTGAGSTVTIDFDITEIANIATSFSGDTGTATPAANSLTMAGGTGIDTSGAGSTMTIDFDITEVDDIATSFSADTGTATPTSNSLTIEGDATQGSVTSATGDTVTITNTDATESQIGVSAFATNAEAITGTISNKVLVPSSLDAKLGTTQPTNSLAYSQGDTSAFGWTSALTDGQLVIGNTIGTPTAANITGGSGIDVTNSANSITLDISSTTALSFPTDTGTATPAANALTMAGGTGIDTSGSGSTVTVAFDVTEVTSIATSFSGDIGTATPSANSLTIAGGTGIDTSGSSSTMTIGFDVTEVASIPTSFSTDSGTATPATNSLSIAGGTGMDTSGSGSTITLDFDVTEIAAIATSFSTDTGTATPATNSLSISGGTGIDTTGAGSTVTIDFDVSEVASIPTSFPTDSGTATPATNALTIAGGTGISTSGSSSTATISLDTPVVVANGGSGRSSTTAYAVICGGTGSTTAHQSIASVGSANQVLTSNGASSLPTFQNAGSSTQDFELIDTEVASFDSTIVFTGLSSTYYRYEVIVTDLNSSSSGVNFHMRTSTNNGISYDSGTTDYGWLSLGAYVDGTGVVEVTSGDSSDTSMILNGINVGTDLDGDTNEQKTFHINIYNPDANTYTHVMAEYDGYDNSSNFIQGVSTKAMRKSANDVNAIQFFMTSGTIESGTFKLYGIKA